MPLLWSQWRQGSSLFRVLGGNGDHPGRLALAIDSAVISIGSFWLGLQAMLASYDNRRCPTLAVILLPCLAKQSRHFCVCARVKICWGQLEVSQTSKVES